ncbi:DUF4429 domain-containing protein [Actinokineospora auranticolor]|nr:DUF4429 domain-containing protein [Actinokineospora auranticolor]
MTEVIGKDGTWEFDYESVRITPGRGAHPLRQTLGELTVPLAAIDTVAFEADRRDGTLRLRPRHGADPLWQATGGQLPPAADPYRLTVDTRFSATASAFASAVRDARLVAQVPDGPAEEYLLPGPHVPLSMSVEDGTATFDGERIHIEWGWAADTVKQAMRAHTIHVVDLAGVEWTPKLVRFRPVAGSVGLPAKHDPNCLKLWGFKKDVASSALLAAAVTARLAHPRAPVAEVVEELPEEPVTGEDQDTVLRRLRELGALHRDGVLTDEEFAAAKQALLRRL